ncbi:hypothetical protein [Paraburkholderia fungorum]|uniref:hypothetical protein n=1 Tax=Paraburkholderia fungorum TaxID=134537 RepID=UPI00068FF184|nr:hypothetical protein [Paraburkholderia fungorum]USX08894.1 hypothetical protein NHH62_19520 [Paraburkholderia fungorum]
MSTANDSTANGASGRSPVRTAIWVVAAFIAVWLVMALYWKATYHVPGVKELILNGIGLPLLLVAGVAGIRKGFAPADRPVSPPEPPSVDAPVKTASKDPSLMWTMALLDASMRLPAGMNVEEVLALARDGKVVGLHPTLQRLDGAKVFAGSAASIWRDDLDDGLLTFEVAAGWNDEQRRAMLLAAETIDELMQRHATTPVTPSNDALDAAPPPFKLHLLLPERWRTDASTLATWLDLHLERGHWRPGVEPAKVVFAAHPVEALAALDALNVELQQQRSPTRHIVLACDSSLSQQTVDALDGAGQLFAHNRPNGHVLGEGACALLLAQPVTASTSQVAQVHRLVAATRPTPVDQPEQQQGDTVAQLLQKALGQSSNAELAMTGCALVSDADQRSSRRAEITDAAQQAWPDSDIRLRCRHLGLANGCSGAVLALGTIAVAGAHSVQAQQPTFAVSISDPLARGALLVSLPASPDSANGPPPA